MPSKSKSQIFIIRDKIFAFGRRCKARCGFMNGSIREQRRKYFFTRHFPVSPVAIAGKRGQCSARGKTLQIVLLKLGAAGKVCNTIKRPIRTCHDKFFGCR